MFIHVGIHKTGTTFLQEEVFPKMKNVNFKCISFRKDIPLFINFKLIEGKINIFSSEFLTNQNHFKYEEETPFAVADRIKLLFPNAKIIVIFREKQNWKRSLYNQYLQQRIPLPYDKWEGKILKDFDFERYEKHLKNIFDEVLVLKYKELKTNHKEFIQKLCDFIGVRVPNYNYKFLNKSINKRKLKWIGIIKKLRGPELIKHNIIELIKWI